MCTDSFWKQLLNICSFSHSSAAEWVYLATKGCKSLTSCGQRWNCNHPISTSHWMNINWGWSIVYPHHPIHKNGLTRFSLLNEIILDPLSFTWLHCMAFVEFTLSPPHSNVSFVFLYMLFHQQRPKVNNRVWAFSRKKKKKKSNANKKLTVVMVNSESSGRIFVNILKRLVSCVWLCSVWNTCTHMFSLTHIIIGRNPATCRCLDLAAKQKSPVISFLIHI